MEQGDIMEQQIVSNCTQFSAVVVLNLEIQHSDNADKLCEMEQLLHDKPLNADSKDIGQIFHISPSEL
jgi:hypothetical protein